MFDVGFPELLLVSLVMLLVFGPERLPEVLRTVGRFVGGARRSFANLRDELEREVGADEIRRELHNSRIMEDARRIGDEMRAGRDEVEELLGRRYAELEESGHVPSRAEAQADAADAKADAGSETGAETGADGAAAPRPSVGTATNDAPAAGDAAQTGADPGTTGTSSTSGDASPPRTEAAP